MNDQNLSSHTAKDVVLVVENDVVIRIALAEYLRHCGYRVIEAASEEEARQVFNGIDIPIGVLFSAIPLFELAQWVRHNKPGVHVILAASVEKAAQLAGDLCENGPHLQKPYDPQQVVDWVKRLQASIPPKKSDEVCLTPP